MQDNRKQDMNLVWNVDGEETRRLVGEVGGHVPVT